MLAFYSNYFDEIFFGSQPKNDVNVEDFDCETFQTFLDCLIGLKPYTVIDALLIYPVAHKYHISECLTKCVDVLKPTVLNENVMLAFNLAMFYECDELIDSVVNFLKNDFSIIQLLENEDFNQLLTPLAMSKLIDSVAMDSYLWKKVFKWGETYLNKHGKDMGVRRLFEENKILEKFSLLDFESGQSIFDFHNSVTKKKFLDPEEILVFFGNNTLKERGKLPENSEWFLIKEGDEIEETITFIQPLSFGYYDSPEKGFDLEIWRNDIIIYVLPKCASNVKGKTLQCLVKYEYKDRPPREIGFRNPLDLSNLYEGVEKDVDDRSKNQACSIHINEPENILIIRSIICTYKFFCDCRVLKTTMNPNLGATDSKNLYFTKNIVAVGTISPL